MKIGIKTTLNRYLVGYYNIEQSNSLKPMQSKTNQHEMSNEKTESKSGKKKKTKKERKKNKTKSKKRKEMVKKSMTKHTNELEKQSMAT